MALRLALSPVVLPSKKPPREGLSPWTLGGHCTSESTSPGKALEEQQRGDCTGGSGEPFPPNRLLGTGTGLEAGPCGK